MVDYVKLAATAKRLVDANGRTVTFIQFDTTPGDANKPWEGPVDPRDEDDLEASADLKAVFVDPGSASKLGLAAVESDLIKRSEQIMIVAPGTAFALNLADFNEVVDSDATRWKITEVQTLKPATTTLIYIVGVAR